MARVRDSAAVPIDAVEPQVFVVPTDGPESDGTLAWDKTTLVVVEVGAAAGVGAAGRAIGPAAQLFVDANGAYTRKQALDMAAAFADRAAGDVRWFEEPVSSDDLDGLRLCRDRAPAGMDIAAGEYGYDPFYFRRMLDALAVDVLQADATRCLGISGFLKVGALCEARPIPMSAHCG